MVYLKEFDSVHATVTILKSNKASHFENQTVKYCLYMLQQTGCNSSSIPSGLGANVVILFCFSLYY
jgi:hypothetical protein